MKTSIFFTTLRGLGHAVGPPVDEQDDRDAEYRMAESATLKRGEIEHLIAAAALHVEMEEVHDGVAAGRRRSVRLPMMPPEDEAEGKLAEDCVRR